MNRMRLSLAGIVSALCVSAFAAAGPSYGGGTATVFDGLDPKDTVEDPSYEAMGEDLARPLRETYVGTAAPAAVIETIDGETIDLAQVYSKKPVYLKFWATWCVPCRQQMPAFEKLYETLGAKVEVIAVNMGMSDDLASVKKFREKFGLKMPVVRDDGRLAQLFHARVTPQHVLIGKDTKFAYIGHAHNAGLTRAIESAAALADDGVKAAPSHAETAERVFKTGDVVSGLAAMSTAGSPVQFLGGPRKIRGLFFFASWCEWYLEKTRPGTSQACARARESIARLVKDEEGADWVGISGGPWVLESDIADYVKNNNVTFPIVMDASGTLFRSFGVRDLPTIVLLNDEGRIVQMIGPEEADIEGPVNAAVKQAGR